MEAHIQSQPQDNLGVIESLDLVGTQKTAHYVTDRRSVTFYPSGASEYGPSGTNANRTIKVYLTGSDYLDPNTVQLFFRLNSVGGVIQPYSAGAWAYFRRVRVIVGGQLLTDLDSYNRLHEMIHVLSDPATRQNDWIEGAGSEFTSPNATPGGDIAGLQANITALANERLIQRIPTITVSKIMSFKPLIGLFKQYKALMLRYMPIQLEFEVVSTAADVLSIGGTPGTNFTISDVELKADVFTLDNALDNDFANFLNHGGQIGYHISDYITMSQVVNSADFTISMTRAFTRIKSVFITFLPTAGNEPTQFYHQLLGDEDADDYHDRQYEVYLQIGSKKWPEQPMKSASECFYNLRKSIGLHGNAFQAVDINSREYIQNKFIIGLDLEKSLQADFTGYNSKHGDIMTVHVKNTNFQGATNARVYVTIFYDAIVNVSDVGINILD
jgi:hypothetical protein